MEFRKDISGTWKLFGAGGGLYPHEIKTNFTLIRLKRNNQYFIYNSDTLKACGDYSLYDSGYDNNEYFEPFYIRFKKGTRYDSKLTFPIDDDLDVSVIKNYTLIFSDRNVADGYQYFFARTN